MAGHWIQGAVKHPGAFTAKAKAAGESVASYAADEADAPGTLGKQARLAQTFEHMNPAKHRAKRMAQSLHERLEHGID